MQAHGRLRHKLVPTKMHLSNGVGHHRSRLSVRIPDSRSPALDTPNSANNTPITPHLVARGTSNDQEAMTPIMLVGICIAGAACVVLAIALVIRQQRKKSSARTARCMERGIEAAKKSSEHQLQWRRSTGGDASDDTHVVDAVYGEKVRSSFESSDYHALSSSNRAKAVNRAAVTNSVILPIPAAALNARANPKLKAIDVQRANNLHAPVHDPSPLAPLPPALFPITPSSVNMFYGPAIARAHGEQNLPQSSAVRALAVAAGVASVPSSPTQETRQRAEKEAELSVKFSPFRESMFGDGMKLGEHLEIRTSKDTERGATGVTDMGVTDMGPRNRSPNSQDGSSSRNAPSRPGTAGTFGQPLGAGFSFGSRIPYRTHRHAASSISMADVRSVRISFASGHSSPGLAGGFPQGGHSPHGSFSHSHGRTDSAASGATNVVTRKVQTAFPPLLPDELVLSVGEKVTLLQTFDDEWCVVGRDRFGEVEVGAVPAFVFTKLRAGEKIERPMRSTSLGVQVEMSSAPGAAWSSREEVISWSNF
ncbi:hypothetical protein FRC11_002992 [Ceratobasidium sp. 423]|nr:hypothetical protein FRC11_002992 [Ceratobasidium sp. 423]